MIKNNSSKANYGLRKSGKNNKRGNDKKTTNLKQIRDYESCHSRENGNLVHI